MNTHDIDIELPPLPTPDFPGVVIKGMKAIPRYLFTGNQMAEYGQQCATAAIEADRQRRGEPSKCPECSDPDLSPEKHWRDGYDDGVAAALRKGEPSAKDVIQQAVNAIGRPAGLTDSKWEYLKAGIHLLVTEVNRQLAIQSTKESGQ